MKLTPKLINDYCWEKSVLCWVIDNHIKNEKGEPLEFTDHRFLKDIFEDWTPIQTCRKASQIGFTTLKMIKSLYAAKYRKWNIIYTLPTFQMVQEIMPAKINAFITQNPILSSWIKDKDSIYQKQVDRNFIYYRGTASGKTEKEKMESGVGISLTADLLIHDECDRSDQVVLEQYGSRLGSSKYQGRWYFSNPTTPNEISQKLYEKSDQKHWFIKCEHCKHWQYLDYWKNVKDYKFVCQKCGKEISDDVRRNGQWIKKYNNRDISGYWISHLIAPWISAKQIQTDYETKTRQYFYNFVLGLPYIGSDVVVSKDIILRNLDQREPNFQQGNVLGVDQGLDKHWVLGNHQGIFAVGKTDKWEDIERLIKVYDVQVAVFDALPDLTEPRKLRDKYPGIVWLNYYKKEVRKADFIKWDDKTHTVFCDRSKIIQLVIDEMVDRKIRFQMRAEELGDYIRHWESAFKLTEKDNMDIERDVWDSSGEDHYLHATNYWRLALEKIVGTQGGIIDWEKKDKIYDGKAPEIKKILKEQETYL